MKNIIQQLQQRCQQLKLHQLTVLTSKTNELQETGHTIRNQLTFMRKELNVLTSTANKQLQEVGNTIRNQLTFMRKQYMEKLDRMRKQSTAYYDNLADIQQVMPLAKTKKTIFFKKVKQENSLCSSETSFETRRKEEEMFLCLITMELMIQPVDLPCGHCFEKQAIEKHLQSNKNCPLCREPLKLNDFRPNRLVKQLIEHFKQKEDKIKIKNEKKSCELQSRPKIRSYTISRNRLLLSSTKRVCLSRSKRNESQIAS